MEGGSPPSARDNHQAERPLGEGTAVSTRSALRGLNVTEKCTRGEASGTERSFGVSALKRWKRFPPNKKGQRKHVHMTCV